MDLWCRNRPLYQLSHNHCPCSLLIIVHSCRCNLWSQQCKKKVSQINDKEAGDDPITRGPKINKTEAGVGPYLNSFLFPSKSGWSALSSHRLTGFDIAVEFYGIINFGHPISSQLDLHWISSFAEDGPVMQDIGCVCGLLKNGHSKAQFKFILLFGGITRGYQDPIL